MEHSINIMLSKLVNILKDNEPSIFLFGSVVLDDFKLGWSDIDIICLTNKAVQEQQANELVNLRQTLLVQYQGNPYFRLFEGGILTLDAFLNNDKDTVVYWGTSGQRLTDKFELDPFARIELLENGRLLFGNDFRHLILYPTKTDIVDAIQHHYTTIRMHGKSGGGWLLDIARCLYTLKTGKVIAKTKAGEWAIKENLCPDVEVMKRVVEIRKNPLVLINDEETKQWQKTLEPYIQKFADVLEAELRTLQASFGIN